MCGSENMNSKIMDDVCEVHCIHEKSVSDIKQIMLVKDIVLNIADVFKLLGDPTRVEIIYALSHQELCVCDVAAVLGISQSAVSHQLRLLRNARLVKFRKQGKIVYYSLDDSHITNLFNECLEHINHR